MSEFEESFVKIGINYRVIGGKRLYERIEIRDEMEYMRVVEKKEEDMEMERIIKKKKRGIGEEEIRKINEYEREREI